jgi:uncharacterized protein
MTARFLNIAFTPSVQAVQEAQGSRRAYARRDDGREPDTLTADEMAFIAGRDSFYMATTGSGGWPYIQHRGGAPGFVKVLGDRLLGIADYRGNRQYVSVGNLADDNRVALFFMDYARQARLKLFARARMVNLLAEPALAAVLVDGANQGPVERGIVFEVEAFDWNCSQHITERYTLQELAPAIDALRARIAELEAQVKAADIRPADRSGGTDRP